MGKPTIWVSDQVDTNRPVQSQMIARSLKFRMKEEEGLYYPCSENKGADQLRGYREADLRLCFRICRLLVYLCSGSYFLCKIRGSNQHLITNITFDDAILRTADGRQKFITNTDKRKGKTSFENSHTPSNRYIFTETSMLSWLYLLYLTVFCSTVLQGI